MMRAAVYVLLIALLPAHARAEARIALLIGNQDYNAKVGRLNNPHQDVTLVGAALKQLGFQVTILKDVGYRDLDIAIKRFISDVRSKERGAISFFYYSGDGAANPDTQINYLIPVDVADPNDGNLWYQSFQQNDLIEKLSKQAPNATHYVVFDACRNELNLSGPAAKAIGAEKGFVPVAQTPGLLIAYATAQGKTASDIGDGGGPYAKALATEIVKPGIEAVTMFRNVQIRVKEDTGQDPWLSFPGLPTVFFAGRGEEKLAVVPEQKAERSPALLDNIVIRRSNSAGGTGGEPFDEKFVNTQAAPVTGLTVTVARSVADQRQKLIASVQADWSDVAGPIHGRAAGGVIINPETRTVRFGNDEAVRQVTIFHRRFNWSDPANAPVWVSGIKLRTSKGTYAFGDVDGTATECTLARSEQIIGFFGRAGAYIDALGCLIR